MNLLIVAATPGEIAGITAHLQLQPAPAHTIECLISGVGSIATTWALTRQLCTRPYDLVLQAGVGGSFDDSIALGEVVQVMSDTYGDLGAEDHDNHLDIFDMGLIGANEAPHTQAALPAPELPWLSGLRQVTGLTVNKVSGNAATIARLRQRYGRQVESMEGAALHYVCLREGVPFAQVRAISNYVIPRDKNQWRMKEAIINLNQWLIQWVEGMQ